MDVRILIRKGEEGGYSVDIDAPTLVGELTDGIIPAGKEQRFYELYERLNKQVGATNNQEGGDIEEINRSLQEIGSFLFQCLDQDDSRLHRILKMYPSENDDLLRFELRIRDQQISSWPWELLFDQALGAKDNSPETGFLALSTNIALSRYHELPIPIARPEVLEQLRVLVVTETVNDSELSQLAKENIAALNIIAMGKRLHIDTLENVSFTTLAGHLMGTAKPYHIIHFIGHGRFDPPVNKLLFSDGADGITAITAIQFAEILQKSEKLRLKNGKETLNHPDVITYPQLVILDACHSANMQNGIVSVSNELVNLGIPAVIGMRQNISAAFTLMFNDELYVQLLDGRPIDLAMSHCRKATRMKFQDYIEWSEPKLWHTFEKNIY